jgi:hypothetical protein
MSDIVFLDTETLGVKLDSPIWEVAAIRRRPNPALPSCTIEDELHIFVHHDIWPWYDELPEEFQADHDKRFDGSIAHEPSEAAHIIHAFFTDRPHVVGAVPNFDTERISHQLLHPAGLADPWHYHLIDVENLAVGYLHGVAARAIDEARERGEEPLPGLIDRFLEYPWKSDVVSHAIGVNPDDFSRHTAMGDVLWAKAQYDAIVGIRDRVS